MELGAKAAALIMEGIRATLQRYRVEFDTYFLEGSLHEGDPSPIDVAFARLREEQHVYESEGALWLRTTEFGDDKDRVLKRTTGAPTYFAADVAYQEDKFLRGFDRAIYVLGADHHGYIARLKAIASSLGEDPARVEVPILQFVHIVEGGGRSKMSEAPRRLRHARRADRAHRRRRHALVRCSALARLDDRPRRRARRQAGPGEPRRTTSSTRTRGSRRSCATSRRTGEGLRRATRAQWRSTTPSASSCAGCWRSRARCATRSSGARRTRIASYALELAQSFAAFYRDSPVLRSPTRCCGTSAIALCVASQGTARPLARPTRRLRPGVDVTLTVPARLPAPYVHVDNRGMVICRRRAGVSIPVSQMRACAETFQIITAEGRATRARGRASSR